jgi:hypothetical protein
MPGVTSTAPKETPMRKASSWTRKGLPSISSTSSRHLAAGFGEGHAAQQDEELVAADAPQQMLVAQRLAEIRLHSWRSTSSPAVWPNRSFTVLKRSRSM